MPARAPSRPAAPPTVADALYRGARRLARAGVFFGHGTDNAGDEAAALLWSTLGLSWPVTEAALRRPLRPAQQLRYDALLQQRIDEVLASVRLSDLLEDEAMVRDRVGLPPYVAVDEMPGSLPILQG